MPQADVPLTAGTAGPMAVPVQVPEAQEQHYTIRYGDAGYSYDAVFGPYLAGAEDIRVEDPYIRARHQIQNFVRFCETVLRAGSVKKIHLVTCYEMDEERAQIEEGLDLLRDSLDEHQVALTWEFNLTLHDREVRLSNGWIIKIGRGLDYFMKPENWFAIGASDMDLRQCLETKVDVFRK